MGRGPQPAVAAEIQTVRRADPGKARSNDHGSKQRRCCPERKDNARNLDPLSPSGHTDADPNTKEHSLGKINTSKVLSLMLNANLGEHAFC